MCFVYLYETTHEAKISLEKQKQNCMFSLLPLNFPLRNLISKLNFKIKTHKKYQNLVYQILRIGRTH